MSDLPPELKRETPPPLSSEGSPPLKNEVPPIPKGDAPFELTTDSWPTGKIFKHVLLPKPKGSPKAGKKEIGMRAGLGAVFAVFAYSMFFGSTGLPGCSSGATTDLVEQIINGLPVAQARNTKFVKLNDIEETGYNKESGVRACTATLITTAGQDGLRYSISWDDKKAKTYVVRADIL